MNPDRGVNFRMLLSQGHGALEGATVRITGADVEHRGHPGVSGSRNYFVAIAVVFRTVDMAMGIDELSHWLIDSLTQWLNDQMNQQSNHFKRAPFGTSSANVANTGFPSSPTEAAKSIP